MTRNKSILHNERGQTLIALLIFMMLAIMITVTSIAITIINLQGGTGMSNGEIALSNATTGAENALEQLERDPTYTGETMTLTDGTATITVSGSGTKTIVSVGAFDTFERTVTVTATYASNIITETSWVETP